MCAALLGVVLKNMEYGKWLVIALVCFGQNLVTFAEKFWWLWGKYVLVFLLISIFDFIAGSDGFCSGYFVGFSLAMAAIVLDHFVWRYEKLSLRPMAQLKLVEGGNRNSLRLSPVISTATLICALSCSFLFDFSEPGWVGITALYLLNSNVAAGYKRVVQRILGTLLAYFLVTLSFQLLTISLSRCADRGIFCGHSGICRRELHLHDFLYHVLHPFCIGLANACIRRRLFHPYLEDLGHADGGRMGRLRTRRTLSVGKVSEKGDFRSDIPRNEN